MSLRCLSYNIHSCFGTDRQYNPDRIRDVIAESQADIVALQEVDSSIEVKDGVDQLRYLADGVGMYSVIGPTLKRGYGAYGNAILSRWPIRDTIERDLSYRRFEPRGTLEALIETDQGKIRVINTHLGLKRWERRFQIARLLEALPVDLPLVLMGDFNEWLTWSLNLRRLRSVFGESVHLKTFPSWWPRFKLDRIYFLPKPSRMSVRTIQTPLARVASDHLPVVCEVSLSDPLLQFSSQS